MHGWSDGVAGTHHGVVGPLTAPQIIDLLHEYGAVRQLAGVTAMPDGEYTITRKTANMSFSFVDEAGAISETNPTVDSVKLVASKLAGIAPLPLRGRSRG